jgi:hypothetical protein
LEAYIKPELVERIKEKGQYNARLDVNPKYREHFEQMCGDLDRMKRRQGIVSKWNIEAGRYLLAVDCWVQLGYSEVEKEGSALNRSICNAVPLNEIMRDIPGTKFRTYSISSIYERLARMDELHHVSVDSRHWYHQIPVGVNLRRLFMYRFSGGTDDPERRKKTAEWFQHVVLPMGWQKSCFIGQSLTWSMVLYRGEGAEPLGIRIEEIDLESPPELVDLYDEKGAWTGFIVVSIDNVSVFVTKAELAERWVKRLKFNAESLNIELKDGGPEYHQRVPTPVEGMKKRFKGRPGGNFSGIQFGQAGAKLKEKKVEKWKAQRVDFTADVTFSQLSITIGRILWWLTVKEVSLFMEEDLYLLSVQLGKATFPFGRDSAAWKRSAAALLTDERRVMLAKMQDDMLRNDWHPIHEAKSYPNTCRVATDATLRKMAAVWFDESFEVCELMAWRNEDFPEVEGEDEERIAVFELLAIVLVVRSLIARGSAGVKLVVATDNTNVMWAIRNRHHKCAKIREYLRELHACRERIWIVVDYIPTKHNVADIPTRHNIGAGEITKLCEVSKYESWMTHHPDLEMSVEMERLQKTRSWFAERR